MLTKQQRNPYIWDSSIKIRTKNGTYEKEDKPKVLVKEIKNERIITKNLRNSK